MHLLNASLNEQTLGDRLRTFRERAGLTQAEVAAVLDITSQAYSHYETGRRSPSADNFYKIAQLYHTSMECLLTGYEDSSVQLFQEITSLPPEARQEMEHFIEFLQSRHVNIEY